MRQIPLFYLSLGASAFIFFVASWTCAGALHARIQSDYPELARTLWGPDPFSPSRLGRWTEWRKFEKNGGFRDIDAPEIDRLSKMADGFGAIAWLLAAFTFCHALVT